MKLYVNEKNEIHAVGTTEDTSLTEIIVDDDAFGDWSVAKICCHKLIGISEDNTIMVKPYVDSHLIELIDKLGKANMSIQAQLDYVAMMTDVDM